VAEDEETDVMLLKRAFKSAGVDDEIRFVSDGEEAIKVLNELAQIPRGRLPALVILDLNMPRMGGLEVLKWMRSQPEVRNVPVVVFSSSASQKEIDEVYAAGANAYVLKPPSLAERATIACFFKSWLSVVFPPTAVVGAVRYTQIGRSLG
jgi:CheY-like chemotaxis protein